MLTLLFGSAVVWGLATAVFGSWQGGLVVAVVVFAMTASGMKARREQLAREDRAQAARDVLDALYAEEPRRRWFR